jgi:hypothetical protein
MRTPLGVRVLRSNVNQRPDLLNGASGGALCRPRAFDDVGKTLNDSAVA